jgi:hypothetical protein
VNRVAFQLFYLAGKGEGGRNRDKEGREEGKKRKRVIIRENEK